MIDGVDPLIKDLIYAKREAVNGILNTKSKNALDIFSTSNGPTGVTSLQ